jgi:hypothetical protein
MLTFLGLIFGIGWIGAGLAALFHGGIREGLIPGLIALAIGFGVCSLIIAASS